MRVRPQSAPVAKTRYLTQIGFGGLAVLLFALDAVAKLIDMSSIQGTIVRLGYPLSLDRTLGLIELVCLGFYVIPRTSAFGGTLLNSLFGETIGVGAGPGEPTHPEEIPAQLESLIRPSSSIGSEGNMRVGRRRS